MYKSHSKQHNANMRDSRGDTFTRGAKTDSAGDRITPGASRDSHGDSLTHPGFKAVENQIAEKEGISEDRAGAILASSSRHASPAAKKANLRLNRVKG